MYAKKDKKCLFAALSVEMTTWALFSGTSLFTTREHDDSRLVIFTRHRFLLTVFENDEESGKCNGLNCAILQLHRILLSFAIRLIDEFTHKFLSLFTCEKLFAISSQVWLTKYGLWLQQNVYMHGMFWYNMLL